MTMSIKKAVAFVATALLVLLAGAAPAFADAVTIRKVDTTSFPKVQVVAQVASEKAPTLDQFSLRENDKLVNPLQVVPIGQTDTPVGVVLVIDTSGSMRDRAKIEAARAAAKQFVAAKGPNDQIAIVAFSAQPRVVSNFTADANLLNGAIDGLTASGDTALWDAVRLSSGLYRDRPDLQANMVVLSDGADTTSSASAADARAAALGANASVYAVGLRGGTEFDAGGLQALASATGGRYDETTDPTTLGNLYSNIQRAIQNQYELSYDSTATGVVNLALSVANAGTAKASAPVGGTSNGLATNQPEVIGKSPYPSFLEGSVGKWLIALMALAAAGLLAYALLQLVVRSDQSTLQSALRPYSDEADDAESARAEPSLAESALIRRAVDTTARIARERGVLDILEKKLEQADLPLRSAEALFFSLVLGVIVIIVATALGGFIGLVASVLIVGLLPIAVLNTMAGRRRRKFASQLPDMLQLLAGSLRAGYSLLQGVDAVAQEVDDPMGQELRRVLAEARLGRPLEAALEEAAERMSSADFAWAVMAVGIQREVGGNLAELLDTVAETMIQRERLRREVRSLTAEGRVSAFILGLLPLGLGIMMFALNRDYIEKLWTTGIGQAMLAGSAALVLVGFVWMKKIVEIEI
jgi:tight adherence protein B